MLVHGDAKFVQNLGQWDKRAQFVARTPGLTVWLEDRGIDMDYYVAGGTQKKPTRRGQVVSMEFAGGKSKLKFTANTPTGGKSDYLLSQKVVRQAQGFAHANASSIYPGVDLSAYFDNDKPRYDLIVKPNADPSQIKLSFRGSEGVKAHGAETIIKTKIGDRIQGKLLAYQELNGKRMKVGASFVQLGPTEVGIKLGAYDKSKALVIDPLVYGTYYGGDAGFDEVRSVVADVDGGVYMTGYTQSIYFPVLYGPYFYNLEGIQNAFLAKLEGDAFNEDYAAFVGGSVQDWGQFVKLDPYGNVWMAGTTLSSDFPGSPQGVHKYNVQYLMVTQGTSPIQYPTGGNFALTYGGQVTAPIPYNATAAQVAAALITLPALTSNLEHVTAIGNGQGIQNGDIYEIDLNPIATPQLIGVISTYNGFLGVS